MAETVAFLSGEHKLVGALAVPVGGALSRPGLVLCHGLPTFNDGAAYADNSLPELADRLAASLGWVVLSFAMRGCGESAGDFSLSGWVEDILSAVGHLRSTGVRAVWLAGFGTGGALGLCAAAADHEGAHGLRADPTSLRWRRSMARRPSRVPNHQLGSEATDPNCEPRPISTTRRPSRTSTTRGCQLGHAEPTRVPGA